MERQIDNRDIEKLVLAKHPHEVEPDETFFAEKTSVKDLQVACKEWNLLFSGSKGRNLERLMNLKVNIETQMQLSIANKIYEEQQRLPVTIGQPKLASLADQERHFVTHMPHAGWCQACGVRCQSGQRGQACELRGTRRPRKESHPDGLLLHLHW